MMWYVSLFPSLHVRLAEDISVAIENISQRANSPD